jgi:hypothetical protein
MPNASQPMGRCCNSIVGSREKGQKFTPVLVIAIVVGLILAGLALKPILNEVVPATSQSVNVSPRLSVLATAPTSAGGYGPAAGASIALFSAVPYSFGVQGTVNVADLNQTNNSYFMQVFNGTTNVAGEVNGTLSSQFTSVISEWQSTITPITNDVSLLVQGTYSIVKGNLTYVYHYFNNFAYNPRTDLNNIKLSVDFDTSTPAAVIPTAPSGLTLDCTGLNCECIDGVCCPVYSEYVWTTVNETTRTGPYPIVFGNDSAPSLQHDSLSVAAFTGYTKLQFGFNSAQGTKSVSGVLGFYMSSSTSWNSSTVSGTFQGASADASWNSSQSAAVVFMDNVTLEVVNQNESLDNYGFFGSKGSCGEKVTFVETATTIQVVDMASSSFGFHGESPNAGWAWILQSFLRMKTIPQFSNYTLGPTDEVSFLNAEYNATGYTSSANALKTVEDYASIFVSSLGVALAVMVVNSICGIYCLAPASEAVEAAGIITSVGGWILDFLTALNSISVSFVDTNSIQWYGFTNDASGSPSQQSGFNLFFYMSLNATALSGISGGYSANLPVIDGIACAPSDYPGHGC